MLHHRNALSIIQYRYNPPLRININLQSIHGRITLFVIRRIDNNLVKDFVEAGSVGNLSLYNLIGVVIENEHGLGERLDGANVGIGTEENVFQLRLLLVDLFDSFDTLSSWRRW